MQFYITSSQHSYLLSGASHVRLTPLQYCRSSRPEVSERVGHVAPSGCCDVSLFQRFGLSAVTRCEYGRPFSLGSFRSAVKEGAFPISVDSKNVCESSRTLIISKVQYIICHNKITTMNGHERRLTLGKLNVDVWSNKEREDQKRTCERISKRRSQTEKRLKWYRHIKRRARSKKNGKCPGTRKDTEMKTGNQVEGLV